MLFVAKLHLDLHEIKSKLSLLSAALQPPGADGPFIAPVDVRVNGGLLASCFDQYASAARTSASVVLV